MSQYRQLGSWLVVGGVTGLLSVVFGAFGAHGIEEAIPKWYTDLDLPEVEPKSQEKPTWYRLDQLHEKKLRTWITGVRYQFYHALAILAVGVLQIKGIRNRQLDLAGLFFLLGMIGFSGSIYLYVITKVKFLGMTAALGGVIFVLGWLFFVIGVLRLNAGEDQKSASG